MAPADDTRALIYGHNDEPGLLAVEIEPGKSGPDQAILYFRGPAGVRTAREPFRPFLWIETPALLQGARAECDLLPLEGGNPLKTLARFPSWKEMDRAVAHLKKKTGLTPSDPRAPYFLLNDPQQQHLMDTGRTCFKELPFGDLRRMQVDIETYTDPAFEFPNAEREPDRIIAIALADESGWVEVLSGAEMDEKALLERFVRLVRERDPDVIEGHNLFKFDLPYLATRAARHEVPLALGRDGSAPRFRAGRFIVADRTISYPRADLHGRHIVDTFFLAQIYDVTHRSLESFGLKDVAAHFGLSAPDREHIEGGAIARTFARDPDRVMKYARDDIVETRALSNLLSPTFFLQAQMLPFSYQNIVARGNAAKIDALLLRSYLRAGHSVPRPEEARPFEGGYTGIFLTGLAKNVHHCDVRSLYPSILLKQGWAPERDEIGVFRTLLLHLRELRLGTRRRMEAARSEDERHLLDATQSAFKVLINSFYGYLGFAPARFNDFSLAERVTAEGRAILRRMIEWLRANGAQPVEIDTDGVYCIPPPFDGPAALAAFRSALQRSLPPGIEVEFDGEYRAMFSYKMKNYALLDDRGEITIKGAALKSRGLEPFQRDFMEEWIRLRLEERAAELPDLARRWRERIEKRECPIEWLAKTEMLQDAPAGYQAKVRRSGRARSAAYELALRSGREYRAGDLVSYYVTGDRKSVSVHSSAKLVSDWDAALRDENVAYYRAKLDALCRKFDAMASDSAQAELRLESEGKNETPQE
jgi:DNA polymerase elongation subunit (family B)